MEMNKKIIFSIAVPGPFREALDYLAPNDFVLTDNLIGRRVNVPLRNKHVVGVVLNTKNTSGHPETRLKQIVAILDDFPVLDTVLLKLTQWASDYYCYPIGEVVMAALPTALRQGKDFPVLPSRLLSEAGRSNPPPAELTLNSAQQHAIDTVLTHTHEFMPFLLHGVTGSGKTEVYLRIIETLIQQKKQILILVPEIGLTPQIFERFQTRFNVPIAIIHSGLNDREKLIAWHQAKNNISPIIIGTRSAIFTPAPHLGLIIVDEEHDLSFKQQDKFRYSARDLSLLRAQFESIPILLGSATPSLESWHKAETKKYSLLSLPMRAGKAQLPHLRLIDMRKQTLIAGLSPVLLSAIKKHLSAGKQVLLFLNRRGYAPSLLCHHCGYIAQCTHCDARLTLHRDPACLRCHHCDYVCPPHTHCPQCHSAQLITLGQGTQKLETELQTLFPEYPIVRVDRDNTRRKHAMKNLLKQIQTGEGKLLIGTQMLAKGHHFPDVTLVAILDIDMGLSSTDFRATERIAQLILQVAGRSGREEQRGEVLIQTHFPDHALLNLLLSKGYPAFAHQAMHERKEAQLPPYYFLAVLRAESTQPKLALEFLKEVKHLAQVYKQHVEVMGPITAPMEKKAGQFRAQLVFHASKRSSLHAFLHAMQPQIAALKLAKKVRHNLDVDPQDML